MTPKIKDEDFKDPFAAGQMVGMLIMLTFIEQKNGIPKQMLYDLKDIAASKAQIYFEIPTEDVHLMVDKLVKEMEK
jgi:hypothetical protein